MIEREEQVKLFWRAAVVFAAATLIWLLVGAGAELLFGVAYNRTAHLLRALLTTALALPLVVLARRFLDQRPFSGLGLSAPRTGWKPLLIGALCWLIPALIGMVASLLLGWTSITPLAPLGETLLGGGALLLLVFLYEALPEELIFRGYFYTNLASRFPIWAAVVGQAALFTLWGWLNGGENSLDRSLLFFTFAVVVGIIRAVSGSVWAAVGYHLVFQTFAQWFGSIGGQFAVTNPQTLSLFAFGILPFGFGITVLRWFYRERLEPKTNSGTT